MAETVTTVFWDASSAEPVLPEAQQAWLAAQAAGWGDPSRLHRPGRLAAQALDAARQLVADALGARPDEVVFPSSGVHAAHAAVAGLALPTTNAVISLLVFVVIASLTIADPVTYYVVGGEAARTSLDGIKEWLALHNDAVMTVLFLVLGVNLISKGIPPLV